MAMLVSLNEDSSNLLTHIRNLMTTLSIDLEMLPENLILPSKSSRRARKDPTYIPRPMNEWIIYRRNYSLRLLQEGRKVSNPQLAREAREKYNQEPPEVKHFFVLLKEYGKLWHKERFPTYRYQPHRTSPRRQRNNRVNRRAQPYRPVKNVHINTTTESDSSSADEMIRSQETIAGESVPEPEPQPNVSVPELTYGSSDPFFASLFLEEELSVDEFQCAPDESLQFVGEFDYAEFEPYL